MAVLAVACVWVFASEPLLKLKMMATVLSRQHAFAEFGPGAAALGFAVHMGVATGIATQSRS